MFKKLTKVFAKRVWLNLITNLILGIGIGLLIYQYVTDWMPLLGGALVLISLLIYFYIFMSK